MKVTVSELTKQLNHYLHAGPKARAAILDKTIKSLESLPPTIATKSEATKALHTMIYSTAMINFANDKNKSLTLEEPIYPKPNYHVYLTSNSTCRFIIHNGQYELPLFESDDRQKNNWLKSLLDEYLEINHSNLYETAATDYNTLNKDDFCSTLRDCIEDDEEFSDEIGKGLRRLKLDLLEALGLNVDNSVILKQMVDITRAFVPNGDEKAVATHRKLLSELRARFQISTFKLTAFYTAAIHHVISEMKSPLVSRTSDELSTWAKNTFSAYFIKHHINENGLDEEHKNYQSAYLTLLQAIAKFEDIPSAHLLCVFKANPVNTKTIDNNQYQLAREALINGAKAAKNELTQETTANRVAFDAAMEGIEKLKNKFKDKDMDNTYKLLVTNFTKLHTQLASLAKSDNEDIEQLTLVATTTSQ